MARVIDGLDFFVKEFIKFKVFLMPTNTNDSKELEGFTLSGERLVYFHRSAVRGEIASSAIHQLHNILFSSLSSLERISTEAATPLFKEELSLVKQTVQDGTDIVSSMQRFFKTEPHQSEQEVDINKVIDDAVVYTNLLCKPKPQFIRTEIHVVRDRRKMPKVMGSHSELTQAFADIIVNAVEALLKGGQIIIRTKTDRKWVMVSVTDPGTGIPDSLKDRIFNPFFTTKGPKAIGLGLTYSKTIFEKHGGLIEVESQEGLGSTFTVKLPTTEHLERVAKPASSVVEIERAKLALQGQKILLIDDEEPVVELLSRILEKANHKVTSAYDGREGIHCFKESAFDAVFIDLVLPDMSGLEVARSIRNLNSEVKIIMLTAWGEGLDKNELEDSGVDLVAPKPFTINTILNLIGQTSAKSELGRGSLG